jgi:DNA-binding PucR family transcriptional regulator
MKFTFCLIRSEPQRGNPRAQTAICLAPLEAQGTEVDDIVLLVWGMGISGYDKPATACMRRSSCAHSAKQKTENRAHYAFYEEMGIARLFGAPEIRTDLLSHADQVLQPILKYDAEHDGKLLETVRAYFEHGGNLRKISEMQFTHYNTVVYRINRIRDTLKIDLKNPETAFSIQFALKIRDLIG